MPPGRLESSGAPPGPPAGLGKGVFASRLEPEHKAAPPGRKGAAARFPPSCAEAPQVERRRWLGVAVTKPPEAHSFFSGWARSTDRDPKMASRGTVSGS